jgi:hypothetical protein
MRTTIDIPDPLYRQLKATAAASGSSVRKTILLSVEKELRGASRGRRVTLPLIKGKETRKLSLTNAEIHDILFG